MTKSEFIQTIREYIAEGKTEEALDLLGEHISEFDKSLLKDTTLMQSRFQSAHDDYTLQKNLERDEFVVITQQVNYAILDLLEKLEKDTVIKTDVAKDKSSGRILHNIAGTMPVAKETRCIVRIAYDEVTVKKDFKMTADTVIESIAIAEVMSVELLDFNEVPAFQIRTANDTEQFVANEDYTQWLFLVKPLHEGKFPLMLKVVVLEQIDGKERKRNIVLEKEVYIISQVAASAPQNAVPAASEVLAFEDTNMKLNYVFTEDRSATYSTSTPAEKKKTMSGVFSVLATIAIACMSGLYIYNGGFGNKGKKDDVVISKPSDKNNPGTSTLDTAYFRVDDPIAQVDTITKVNDIKNPVASHKGKNVATLPNPNTKKTPTIPKKPNKPKPTESNNNSNLANKTTKPSKDVPKEDIQVHANHSKEERVEATPAPVQAAEKQYKVKIKLQGDMKEAEILVNGEKPLSVNKNIWGTPQSVSFKSRLKTQTFTFIHQGIACKVENVLIENEEVTVEACSFKKGKKSN